MKIAFYIGIIITSFAAIGCIGWLYDIFIANSFRINDLPNIFKTTINLISGIVVIIKTKKKH